jgi:hypothetical protein
LNARFINIAFGDRIVLDGTPRFIRIAFGGCILLVEAPRFIERSWPANTAATSVLNHRTPGLNSYRLSLPIYERDPLKLGRSLQAFELVILCVG